MKNWLGVKGYTKSLRNVMKYLNILINELNLPLMIKKETLRIHKKAYEKKLTQGRKADVFISACVYIASKEIGFPLDIKELSIVNKISVKSIIRNEKFIRRFMNFPQSNTIESYIIKYCHKLGLKENIITKAIDFSKKLNINRRNDIKAGICIYLTGASSIRKIANACRISRSHLWKCVRDTLFNKKSIQ